MAVGPTYPRQRDPPASAAWHSKWPRPRTKRENREERTERAREREERTERARERTVTRLDGPAPVPGPAQREGRGARTDAARGGRDAPELAVPRQHERSPRKSRR